MNDKLILKALKIAELLRNEDFCESEASATIGKYVIVRTYTAGVFAGNIESRKGKEIVLTNVRRIWKWAGAASLSELAQRGTSKPNECQFPCAVNRIMLTEAIEILDVMPIAEKSIKDVPTWTQVGSGSGDGSGDGSGYGYGDGYGSGDGSGDGDGYGYGYRAGDGDGYGYGYGSGSGDGSGYGDGSGSGDGYGYGDG